MRPHTDASKRKISEASRRFYESMTVEQRSAWFASSRPSGSVATWLYWFNKTMAANWDDLSTTLKRRRVFIEQKHTCARCGNHEWLGEPLPIELEHRDGNNKNWARENVVGLCPNCHSLTPTWRGRDGKSAKKGISDQEILAAFDSNGGSITKALASLGLNAAGGNKSRIRRLLERRGLVAQMTEHAIGIGEVESLNLSGSSK